MCLQVQDELFINGKEANMRYVKILLFNLFILIVMLIYQQLHKLVWSTRRIGFLNANILAHCRQERIYMNDGIAMCNAKKHKRKHTNE